MTYEAVDWRREATSIRPSFPTIFVAGRGCWLTDCRDRTFFDATSGSGAVSLGHQHPRVVQAVIDQVRLLCHTGSRVGSAPRAALMQELPTMLPFQDAAILLTATGAEAVEAAMKIARAATGRRRVVAFRNSFHGKTSGALAVTSREDLAAFSSVRRDEVCQASFPDSPFDPEAIGRALRQLSAAVEGVEDEIAAVLLEPVQITEGVFEIGADVLKGIQGLAREWGALLVVDEVYTGFGRTGRRYYSDCLEQPPDLLILGKALGNGMPIAAVCGEAAVVNTLPSGVQTSTFSGHPVSCAAARAVVAEMRETRLWERADSIGLAAAEMIREWIPDAGSVRVVGATVGFDLPNTEATQAFRAAAYSEDVLLYTGGPTDRTVKLVVPLIVSDDELSFLLHALERALERVLRKAP